MRGPRAIEFDRTDKVVPISSEEPPDLRYFTTLLTVGHQPWLTMAKDNDRGGFRAAASHRLQTGRVAHSEPKQQDRPEA